MSIVFSNVGATKVLTKYFKNESPSGGNNYYLRLFTNNITPTDLLIISQYTEALGGGYVQKTLIPSNFNVSIVNNIAQVIYDTIIYTFTGVLTTNLDIYGYYLVDGNNDLILAEKFPDKFTPSNNGDTITIDLIIKSSKGTPT